MTLASLAKFFHRVQTTIPAGLRRRRSLADGGEVGAIDLGGAALIVPGRLEAARREVRRTVHAHYDEGLAQIDDPDLADQ